MIPFIKSNVAQIAMTYESVNGLWGRVLNPWDKSRTAGGSSGGEGALIASRCTPIGTGADIGGSLRIPAEFCGIYSLKPSSHRLSFSGHT
jgi:fatty acid amide hydrolase